jgi:hypothetical protein
MNEPATVETIARQLERVLSCLDVIKGQMTVLQGILMRTEARAQGLLAEMREWRQSRSDDKEPRRDR